MAQQSSGLSFEILGLSPRFGSQDPTPAPNSGAPQKDTTDSLIAELEEDMFDEGDLPRPAVSHASSKQWIDSTLPKEVLRRVFQHLCAQQLGRMVSVSRFCGSVASEHQLWQLISDKYKLSAISCIISTTPSSMDVHDSAYHTHSRRRAMARLWPRWDGLAAGWNWLWQSVSTLHSQLLLGNQQAALPAKFAPVMCKLANANWVLLYECVGFALAQFAGWIRRRILQQSVHEPLLQIIHSEWLIYAQLLDHWSDASGLLDEECDKERSSNIQRGLPHTPSVIDMGVNAFRKLVLLAPSMLPKLSEAVASLNDVQVAHKLHVMAKHLDIRDDHLAAGHRCMAEAPGDAAGCAAWTQGRLRAQVIVPLRERIYDLQDSDSDDDDYAGTKAAERQERSAATERCQGGAQAADAMHMSWRSNGVGSGDIGYSNNSKFTNLMDEREQCYRASAQQPRKKHKLTPDEFLFQKSGFEK